MARTFEWARHEIFFHFEKGVSCVLYANKVKDLEWNQGSFFTFKEKGLQALIKQSIICHCNREQAIIWLNFEGLLHLCPWNIFCYLSWCF